MRVLVHPFGNNCEEFIERYRNPDPSCSVLDRELTSCQEAEIFDWITQKCVKICSEPLQFVNGKCTAMTSYQISTPRASSAQQPSLIPPLTSSGTTSIDLIINGSYSAGGLVTNSPITPPSVFITPICTFLNHSSMHRRLRDHPGHSMELSADGLMFTLTNSSESLCVQCRWEVYSQSEYSKTRSEIQTTEDQTFIAPVHAGGGDHSIAVCREGASTEEITLMGEICLRVENLVTIIMLCLSIFCLVVMVLVYSALPLLRNVPGNMILSKVCGDKYNYKSSKLKKKMIAQIIYVDC